GRGQAVGGGMLPGVGVPAVGATGILHRDLDLLEALPPRQVPGVAEDQVRTVDGRLGQVRLAVGEVEAASLPQPEVAHPGVAFGDVEVDAHLVAAVADEGPDLVAE